MRSERGVEVKYAKFRGRELGPMTLLQWHGEFAQQRALEDLFGIDKTLMHLTKDQTGQYLELFLGPHPERQHVKLGDWVTGTPEVGWLCIPAQLVEMLFEEIK